MELDFGLPAASQNSVIDSLVQASTPNSFLKRVQAAMSCRVYEGFITRPWRQSEVSRRHASPAIKLPHSTFVLLKSHRLQVAG